MRLEEAVRSIYQKRPYPGVSGSMVKRPQWYLPPLPWMKALWPPLEEAKRILVAGCGSGMEAFAVRRKFPDATIVGADFSPKPIKVAKKLQRKFSKGKPIQFVVADLTSPTFATEVGGEFDFITCNGVLTYVPEPGSAFENFARVMAPSGVAFIGVNGALHFSERWRRELPNFGYRLREFEDTRDLRELLRLFGFFDTESDSAADETGPYLASDLFGPLFHNLPLTRWMEWIAPAGLELLGLWGTHKFMRNATGDPSHLRLVPRSRADVYALGERLDETSFHQMLLTRTPPPTPPWDDARAVLDWRPVRTRLYQVKLPETSGGWRRSRRFTAKSRAVNSQIDHSPPQWFLEIIRCADGKLSVQEILKRIGTRVEPKAVRDELYTCYLLLLLNFVPPGRT